MSVIHWGMSAASSAAFVAAGVDPKRIVQTIGNAPASAGFHAQDGTDPEGNPYCAAVDLSVLHPSGLDEDAIRTVLRDMSYHGFIGWYRNPGMCGWPVGDPKHMHMVYCGEDMKPELQEQVHAWFKGDNGLAGEKPDPFYTPEQPAVDICRALFLAHNPA